MPTRPLAITSPLLAVLTLTLPLRAQEPPTIDRLQSVTPSIAGEPVAWSADGTRLYYLNGADGALWSVPADGGFPSRVAGIDGRATRLERSPDGRTLYWVKRVSGGTDLFAFDLATGRERRVSTLSGTVRSYAVSPDGRSIALANDRNGSEDIYVVRVADGAATRITGSPLYEVFPSWTADGGKVLYTQLDQRWVDHDVYAIAPGGGDARLLFGDKDYFDYRQGASFGSVLVSPDGRTAMFRSQRSGWANYWLIPISGGEPRQLAAESADQSDAKWSPDGSRVLFLSMSNGTQSLNVVAAAGGSARTVVAPATGIVSRAEWSPDGRRIAYQLGTPTKANDLYVVSAAGGEPRRLTAADPNGALAADLVVPEKISWENEGLTIHAYLYKPKHLRAGERAPVVMYVHGGPTGQFSDSYNLQAQFFASRGYVVIAPNVRGSSGYGKRFEVLNNRDWGHGDLRDV
ncbi:MAG: prolyl oligopeptidase family serine peptidase, partial [Gemmatimonadales bacterium]